jgi:murein DD-endopeptidase MepM/ murein hydrolase activator NlpD
VELFRTSFVSRRRRLHANVCSQGVSGLVARWRVLAALLVATACSDPTGNGALGPQPAEPLFGHGAFTSSAGVYRIPYSDGTNLVVTQDHHDHTPPDRIDMSAGEGAQVVAAASGWIRAIVDHHGSSPNAGDGLDINGNPQDDTLEHSCGNNAPENTVVGSCSDYNNYVWIEHPNGEWTKYTHFGTGTVQLASPAGFGWSVGDWINAGEVLGLESDIGQASSTSGNPAFHLHFEVAVPNTPGTPLVWTARGGFFQNGSNVVPLTCGIPNNLYVSQTNYVANPCVHAPPVANAGSPYIVAEGSALVLDGTGSTDPDGNPLTYLWAPADNLDDASLAQPTFVAGDNGVVALTLTVYDQIEALSSSDNTTVTVSNVAPTVEIDPAQVTTIDEGGTVTVTAEFTDPGWLDTHTATVDWGVPPGHEGALVAAPAIQILDAGGPGTPRRGRVQATYRYGDNDAGAGFTIEVTVTDDDGGSGKASFALSVGNVDPDVAIDLAGTVLLNGVPTVVASAGESVPFSSLSQDAGSDDLTLTWDWDDGTTTSRLSLVNPPGADPLPSPTVQPRNEADPRTHMFGAACLYAVTFTAADDDGASGSDDVAVIVTGNADRARSAGYWSSEYRLVKRPDLSQPTLQCYLDIVAHASVVFGEHRPLGGLAGAAEVLNTAGSGGSADEIFDRQLLALWLNFANGAYALDDMVDGSGDGVPDMTLLDLLVAAEELRTDPNRARAAVLAMKDALEALNTAH